LHLSADLLERLQQDPRSVSLTVAQSHAMLQFSLSPLGPNGIAPGWVGVEAKYDGSFAVVSPWGSNAAVLFCSPEEVIEVIFRELTKAQAFLTRANSSGEANEH
jgi:hypothetical protein